MSLVLFLPPDWPGCWAFWLAELHNGMLVILLRLEPEGLLKNRSSYAWPVMASFAFLSLSMLYLLLFWT